jgi:hypothetical protein
LKPSTIRLSLALLATPLLLSLASSPSFSQSVPTSTANAAAKIAAATKTAVAAKKKLPPVPPKAFSRIAVGGGFGLMGGNLQASTNVSAHTNLRVTGNLLNYSVNNISTNGFNLDGKVNMATAGASLDYYPFLYHGFRLSPGILLYNQNQITANATVANGSSITLNGTDYYSASTNAVTGATPILATASLGLHNIKPAATITTGWGNMIPRKGGHWSFPVEIGAAFTGSPSLNMNLTGWACTDAAQTECANLAGSSAIASQVQSNLTAQVAKWKNDVDPLKAYPILTFGATYSFHIR